ncbi:MULTISPECIES: hypothetical protein [Apilactobacillus]|uniref:hypothetical protein n=1 Tax=Apilactobacillus TaxID=2767877 RepID=UPI0022095D3B|nr:hypothetical protein [Apilactobacillus sp. EABW-1NA]MCT6859574.1 hypothetical protein [Apilactobacillus sp.]CAI2559964.1 hypothetical protein AKUH4B103J_01900 [Apilactobacillus kunkeei]MDN2612088.1 hypothetical protein [Apilactobacillus sp. EABW-1NA]CAI2560113.1 hypothetical protein AKUH4B403J_01900 [Apilactobacillus kunkeei]CAI2560763.1 hypothetical protein AKUH4B203M_01900 [Apilactobacillus kunkeei]
MKKFKYVLVSLVAVLAFTAFNFSNSTSANAKARNKEKIILTIPKNMRGTWYSRTNFYGKFKSKLVITKHSIKSTISDYGGTYTVKSTLHKPLTKKQIKAALDANDGARYSNYYVGTYTHALHYKWLKMVTLNMDGDSAPGFLNVHKFNHNVVLTSAAGGPRQSYHYFRTDKLAKKYAHKKFPHFNYGYLQ